MIDLRRPKRGAPRGSHWRTGHAARVISDGRANVQIKRSETWRIFARQVGQRIKHERELRDVAASELAAALGSSVGVIFRWERGINPPHLSSLLAIAQALGCDLVDLIPTPIIIRGTY